MTVTGDTASRELAEIERRARRRWKLVVFTVLPVVILVGVISGVMADHGHHHRHPVRHHSPYLAVILLGVGVLILAAEIAFFVWMAKKHKGLYGPQLIMGLPYRQRRQVTKAVRGGQPPADPTMRAVGVSTAQRLIRYAWLTPWAIGVLVLLGIVNAVLPGRPLALRIMGGTEALIFLGIAPWQYRNIKGARRYLAATGDAVPDRRPGAAD